MPSSAGVFPLVIALSGVKFAFLNLFMGKFLIRIVAVSLVVSVLAGCTGTGAKDRNSGKRGGSFGGLQPAAAVAQVFSFAGTK